MTGSNHQESPSNVTKELNKKFEEKLGINRDKCIEHIQLIKYMAWEQVLLVAMYARSQYLNNNENRQFHSRLEFLALANKYHVVFPLVIQWLDEGVGYLSIIERLRKVEDKSITYEVNVFISACERHPFGFSSIAKPLLYSHFTLLVALNRIVEVFQILLEAPNPTDWCNFIVKKAIRKAYPPFPQFMEDHKPSFTTLDDALDIFKKDHKLGQAILKEIDDELARWMTILFNQFLYHHELKSNDGYVDNIQMVKLCAMSQNVPDNKLTLTFNREHLEQCMTLGQAEQVMNSIREELKTYLGEDVIKAGQQVAKSSHATLSQWYRDCSVLDIRWEKSIPPIVASLLEIDVKYAFCGFGFFHANFRTRFQRTFSNRESEKLTTDIINHCLYHNGKLTDFIQPPSMLPPSDKVEEFISTREQELDLIPDKLMRVWSSNDRKKVKDRFKRPRNEIVHAIENVDKNIREQKYLGLNTAYPTDGPFPLPLWNTLRRGKGNK